MRKVMLLAVVLSIVLPLRPVIEAAQSQPPRSTESINLDTNAQLVAQLLAMGDKEPMYIKPNPDAGGGGGDNAREWEAYKRRAEALMKH
jgi:hypothetical protein